MFRLRTLCTITRCSVPPWPLRKCGTIRTFCDFSIVHYAVGQMVPRESPIPVILFTPTQDYDPKLLDRLRENGYNTTTVSMSVGAPDSGDTPLSVTKADQNIDAFVRKLYNETRTLGCPPLVIASGYHALLMEKYLESLALSALIMVNPLSPNPHKVLSTLLQPVGLNEQTNRPSAIRSVLDVLTENTSNSFPLASNDNTSATFIASLAQCPVCLEPQPVPMLVVSAPCPNAVQSKVAEEGATETADFHRCEFVSTSSNRNEDIMTICNDWIVKHF